MNKYICNYAIIRFLPYHETEEFVNIGIVLSCPELGFLSYKLERKKQKRIFDFFPELNRLVLKNGLCAIDENLARVCTIQRDLSRLYMFADDLKGLFIEVCSIKESIFRYSEPGLILSERPQNTLETLFADLVQRQFAHSAEYQEASMVRKLNASLAQWNLQKQYKKGKVGDDDYNVFLPIAIFDKGKAIKALKPLDLNKETTSKIYDHGDDWIAKIVRLKKMDCMPNDFLFTVEFPNDSDLKKKKASSEICKEFENLNVKVLSFNSFETIHDWAKVV